MRHLQRVRSHVALDRLPHLRTRSKEAVRRHLPLQRLVRPLEVVGLDEELQPPQAIGKVCKDRPRQKLLPQRLPEALHLAQRLRVLRAALHVRYALPPQLPTKLALPSPHRVLPPLVGQDLPRRPVRRDAPPQRLHHQIRLLVVRDRVAHDEPRVVVHEGRQVQPLVLAQQKLKNVALPQLVRLCPLEPPRWRRGSLQRWLLRFQQPLLMQDPPHRRLRNAQRLEARQGIADLARTHFWLSLFGREHRRALRLRRRRTATRRRARRLGLECVRAALAELLHPRVHRHVPQPESPGDAGDARSALHHRLHHAKTELVRISTLPVAQRLRPSPFPRRHVSTLSGWRALGTYEAVGRPINWHAAQRCRSSSRGPWPLPANGESSNVTRGEDVTEASNHRSCPSIGRHI